MLTLISISLDLGEETTGGQTADQKKWWQKAWSGFVDWLLEPIPFPGKVDINSSPPESYNREGQIAPKLPEIDGR